MTALLATGSMVRLVKLVSRTHRQGDVPAACEYWDATGTITYARFVEGVSRRCVDRSRTHQLPALGARNDRRAGARRLAVIRYRAQLEVIFGGHKVPLSAYWHTDTYECRDGQWMVVWSQATAVQ